jgi:hypothetical protein
MDGPGLKNGNEYNNSAGRTVGLNGRLIALLAIIALAFLTACGAGGGAQTQDSPINGTGIQPGKEFLLY